MKNLSRAWLLGAVLLATGWFGIRTVQAEFVQQTFQITNEFFDINHLFNVNQFNPAAGTLTGLEFRVVSELTADLGLENTTVGASNYVNAILPSDWELRRVSDSLLFATCSPTVGVFHVGLAPYDGNMDYQPPSGQTFLGLTNSATGWFFSGDSGLLTDFSGLGTISLRLTGLLGAFSVDGESGKTASGIYGNELGAARIEIGYWYNAIPEPATVGLLLLGLALGWVKFLRRKR